MMTPQLPLAGVPLGNLKRTRVLKVHQKAVLDSVHEVTGLTVTGEQADQIAAACCGLVVQLSKIWVSWFRGVWWWVQKFSWPEEWRWRRCGLYASSSALVCGRHLG